MACDCVVGGMLCKNKIINNNIKNKEKNKILKE